MQAKSLSILLGAALLAGCGNPPSAPVRFGANGIRRPATPIELYDGSYEGRSFLVRAASPSCPRERRHGVVEIGDAVLIYPYTPDLVLSAEVARDGRMHGQTGNAVLDGRIVGNQLLFQIRTPQCETRYRMHFVWNHS